MPEDDELIELSLEPDEGELALDAEGDPLLCEVRLDEGAAPELELFVDEPLEEGSPLAELEPLGWGPPLDELPGLPEPLEGGGYDDDPDADE